jgi:hypothetical protein
MHSISMSPVSPKSMPSLARIDLGVGAKQGGIKYSVLLRSLGGRLTENARRSVRHSSRFQESQTYCPESIVLFARPSGVLAARMAGVGIAVKEKTSLQVEAEAAASALKSCPHLQRLSRTMDDFIMVDSVIAENLASGIDD